ncbi:MAG: DUF1385 domain-containing protein [Acidobacteria bacterium]|nr:DUF1385 domain-containing protein [Acidobacteriota bacterium]
MQGKKTECKLPGIDTIGGQAIIEGVMMRSPNAMAVAVRRKSGGLVIRSENVKPRPENSIWKKPFFRGVAMLGSSLVIGMKAINFSASVYEEELIKEEEKNPKKKKQKEKKIKKNKKQVEKPKRDGMSPFELIFSVTIALGMVIVLYKVIPLIFAGWLKDLSPFFANTVTFNLVDAIVKTCILIMVLWGMSIMSDVKRMYQYHGAEHMAVFTYEADKSLSVDNAWEYDTLHPRCGTNFLILVFVVSLFFFLAIDPEWPFVWKLSLRLLLLPGIAGVTYEVMKWGSKHMDKPFVRGLMAPGLALQRITTSKPDKGQVEVALAAVKEVIEREKNPSDGKKVYEIPQDSLSY